MIKLNEDDFEYVGRSYNNHSMNGFIFRVKNKSADILSDKYDIQRKRIYVNYMYENYSQFIEVSGYSDPLQSDAIYTKILLEDESIIKEILQKALNKKMKENVNKWSNFGKKISNI